jgi:hypothetical protein
MGDVSYPAVKNKKQQDLHYYWDWFTQYSSTKSLLQYKDGSCIAWRKFFADCLKVHGINSNITPVRIGWEEDFNSLIERGILIKNWKFCETPLLPQNTTNEFGKDGFVYVNVGSSFPINRNPDGLLLSNVETKDPLPGQNNDTPPPKFITHEFLRLTVGGNIFYLDPSYGTVSSDYQENIDGYYRIGTHIHNGERKAAVFYKTKSDDGTLPIKTLSN